MIGGLRHYPTMRPSGVPWLGNTPDHWEVKRLAQFGRLFKGSGGSKDDEVSNGAACVRYGDLYTTHNFHILQSRSYISPDRRREYTALQYGDVLFAASGETIDEIGKSAVNLIQSEVYCGGDVILFRSAIDVNPRFMGYATDCRPAAAQKAAMGRGITVKHIYGDQLRSLCVALPPLAEQDAIVRFLDHADRNIRRYIRAKKKLITLLNEQKQVVITRAATRGLDPNARLKPSGIDSLGDVPQHWEIVRFGRLINLTTGFPFKSHGFSESAGDIRLLRGVNVSPGRVRWQSVVRWPVKELDLHADFEMHQGDIVLGMDRPIISSGVRVAPITADDVPSLLVQRIGRIRTLGELEPLFALLLLTGKGFIDHLAPIFTGVSVPHISPEQIRAFRIALPTKCEQMEIVRHVGAATASISAAVDRAEREISLLREYRARLVADVVTGKLDVRDVAVTIPDEADLTLTDDDTNIDDEDEVDAVAEAAGA